MKTSLGITLLALSSAAAWASESPTDPQIAAIVVTANQVDIDAGKLAQSRAHNPKVRDFAQLVKVRPAFVAHFDHAKMLQTSLANGS